MHANAFQKGQHFFRPATGRDNQRNPNFIHFPNVSLPRPVIKALSFRPQKSQLQCPKSEVDGRVFLFGYLVIF